jgi:hypothetical protein
MVWCAKLDHLTSAQIDHGVRMCELQEEEGRRTGEDTFPPSYAGFIGLATMNSGSRKGTYEKRIPNLMPLEDKKAATASILEMLDE